MKIILTAGLMLIMVAAQASGVQRYSIASPDGRATIEIEQNDGRLFWSSEWQGRKLLMPSEISLVDGGRLEVVSVATNSADRVWKPVWGQFSKVQERYSELVLGLKTDDGNFVFLQCRMLNDGSGFRFSSREKVFPAPLKVNFRTEYRFPSGRLLYWPRGEDETVGPAKTFDAKDITVPVVAEIGKDLFAAVLESDLYSARYFSTALMRAPSELVAESVACLADEAWQSAWRVFLFGQSPGDLLMSTTPLNLAAECRIKDHSWIKPGKCMWDWRVHGYRAGEFRYSVSTDSYKRFIRFAATNNIQYLIIDDGWYKKKSPGVFTLSPNMDMTEVMRFAREYGVGVMLYYDRKKGEVGDKFLFEHFAGLGAQGVKYGFMGDDVPFTRETIERAAENHLTVNFHDCPSPMTGVERTMPNAVTREYCHSQQDSRRAFKPVEFLKMAMVNALTGPLDQCNGSYGLNGINAGERERGPFLRNTLNSTVVSETARVLVIFSGLICLPDAPEEYEKKADLFEFIRRMPVTWDETRVLNSRIGECITTARRSGREWFIGSVIDERGGELSVTLDFIEPGINYAVTYYEDAPDTHYINNRELYQVRSGTVKCGDALKVRLAPGGGHCMWIRPL